jgi:DNA-binding LacI/PurR family transcriptional regulator
MMHQITIKDIAKILGISASTVSRALKDHPDISPETKRLVQTFAEKVHYRPNSLALSLRHSKTYTLGIVIPELVHHFFSSVISGIEDVAYAKGYKVMICQSNETQARESTDIQVLVDNRVDGILVSMSKTTRNFDHFERIKENGIPLVFFDRICEAIETDRVIIDDCEGARIAVNHLIKQGCKRIMHLAAPQHLLIGINRLKGYRMALEENNMKFDKSLVLLCDTREDVLKLKEKIIEMAPLIDAVFGVNDSTAITAMQVLIKGGFKIPEQIKVSGFGDGPNTTITSPTLSTVEQKGYEIGREAVKLLLWRIENPESNEPFQTKVLTPELRARESTDIKCV